MTKADENLERAIASQIRAEVTAADTNVKAIAGKIGTDYSALRRYLYLLEPHRPMPIRVFLELADELDIDAAEIISRARRRL